MKIKSSFEFRSQPADMANQGCLKWTLVLLSVMASSSFTNIENSNEFESDYLDYYYSDYYDYYGTNSTNDTFISFETEYHNAINETLAMVANFCPALQMDESHSVISSENAEYQSCCRPCSTSPDCHVMHAYNFCCPQARMAHYWSNNFGTAICMTSAVNAKGSHLDLGYWYVYSCQTFPRDHSWFRNEFDDVVMVYSNGTLYRNKQVAECNGITEYKRWRLVVTGCNYEAVKEQKHEINLVNDVMRECIVYSVPPPDFDVSHFTCHHYLRLHSHCNITGLWERADYRILLLCIDGSDALVYDTDGTAYRNVYCLACNKPPSYLTTPKTCTRSFSHALPVIDELTILVADESDKDFLQHDALCDTSFVRDIYQNTCRPLLCPPGKAPYKGECLLLAKDNNQLLQVMLRLSPSDRITNLDSRMITEQTHKENNERILRHIGIADVCKIQRSDIFTYWTWVNYRKDFADFIAYDIHLYKSERCDERISSFEDKLDLHNRTIVNFPFNAGLISIDVTVEMMMTIPIINNNTVLIKDNLASYAEECTNCSSKMIIPLNCPYIKLQPFDICYSYRIQSPNKATQCSTVLGSALFKANVVTGDELINDRWHRVFYICAHDYNQILLSPRLLDVFPVSVSSSSALLKPFRSMFLIFLNSLLGRIIVS